MLFIWLQFILCSAFIVLCGIYLSKYGDVIAEKTGLGRAWIGLILMSSVTSLPELITGISSVAFAGVPNIALGDIMGSCVFNLSLIALMDMLHGPKPIFYKAEHGHILSAGFGVILIGIACVSILSNANVPSFMHVGIYTPFIIIIYLIAVRGLFLFEKKKLKEYVEGMAEELRYMEISTSEAVMKYLLNAALIVVAATWLPFIADELAEATGLGEGFIGTIFVALTTSLPEVVVSVSALRIGATDLAVANLFGSNIFNIFILAIDDIFYTKGPLLADVSSSHAVTGFIAVIMTGIAVVSLTYRLERKVFMRLGWDAIAMLTAFVINVYLLYSLRGEG